jgi:2-polyprenyl-3-methyl-5-hydroxy-6-metoxy-1,4-benzoquinol methylase
MAYDHIFTNTGPIVDRESYQRWYDANSRFSNLGTGYYMERVVWVLPFVRGETLEIGCQWGGITRWLLTRTALTALDCIDITDAHIMKTTETVQSLPPDAVLKLHSLRKIFLEDLPLDAKYDTIVMSEVLEHVLDPVMALKKCISLLKGPGSRLLLTTPNGNCFLEPDHLRQYTPESMLNDIQQAFEGTGLYYVDQIVTTMQRPGTDYSWIVACIEIGE